MGADERVGETVRRERWFAALSSRFGAAERKPYLVPMRLVGFDLNHKIDPLFKQSNRQMALFQLVFVNPCYYT